MNISQPVASAIESVEFTFLSAEEIKAMSVGRIQNEQTFDTLNNPVPGGLYDPALGSWGDNVCATCHLGHAMCPGHAGHIDLPVPVYHPIFMDQILRLLRAQCAYCHRFRLKRHDVDRYICKLRLLQYGLVQEAEYIDAFGESFGALALPGVPGVSGVSVDDQSSSDEDGKTHADAISLARRAYVRQVLHSRRISKVDVRRGKHEGASESRRQLAKDFFKDIVVGQVCATCHGVSPKYRKDRFVKIFEMELGDKEKAKNAAKGLSRKSALALRHKSAAKNDAYHSDEGIADIDLASSQSEPESDDGSEGEGDDLDEAGEVVQKEPRPKPQSAATAVRKQRYLSTQDVLARLQRLFETEQELLSLVYDSKPNLMRASTRVGPEMFFLQTLLVPPNRYRPEARTGDSQIAEDPMNSLFKMILRASSKIGGIHRAILQSQVAEPDHGNVHRRRDMDSLHQACIELQDCVNSLVDSSKNPIQGAAGKRNEEGIKQKLEKKEGLFRKNMMGKRVNFAARSVISPDPNIETSEIGVPPVFARKLTFPEPVTSHNIEEMRAAVINGVERYPGAAAIENENGQIINLRSKSQDDRIALANQLLAPSSSTFSELRNKKVHRHLTTGDMVIMNRQPTLHKPSMMAHRVRVLAGEKTIRMHYANCNTYNADFDGDEMNMHYPQNEVARAEAFEIADTDHQYISGTQGKPLRGLIQDHLSVSVALCSRDSFFDRAAYQQLIYGALRPENGDTINNSERIELVPPAVIKPVARWTGKQVITTILLNIKPRERGDLWMRGKSQVPGDRWAKNSEEGIVQFRDGVFISGILDKAQLGPASGGLIHAVHEVYGPTSAGKLLSCIGRLLTKFLGMRAFTCGMDDLRLTPEGEIMRKRELKPAASIGLDVAARYVGLQDRNPTETDTELANRLEEVLRDDNKQEGLDMVMNQRSKDLSSNITKCCLPAGLEKQFPRNNMQTMTVSGAKGGIVNANLISCNLGQQVLEGRRVPLMVSGKSLPCFPAFDTSVKAGGYIVSRFLTGIRPQEYYFHHMAGREGLIDTAVKTSRSGYLQRCLIKGMEGLEVAYDSSVRDADGSLVQFLYGEDGLDVTKQKYLTDFEFLLNNYHSQVRSVRYAEISEAGLLANRDEIIKASKSLIKKAKANPRFPIEPLNAQYNPARHAFATSEKFLDRVMTYMKENPDKLIKKGDEQRGAGAPVSVGRKSAEKLLVAKYLRSLAEPGEAVGIVAGQSVGEPSTQMTLNTFHLAGHSAKNVTLGIPRLREILMTASNKISTPSMTLVLNQDMSEADGERFAKSISVLPLAHLLDIVTVKERIDKGVGHGMAKIFDVRLQFLPCKEYRSMYAIKQSDVMNTVERKLLPLIRKMVEKEIKQRKHDDASAAVPDIGKKSGTVEMAPSGAEARQGGDDEGDDDDDAEDGDASAAKRKANRTEEVSYGPNDDDDDAMQLEMERDAAMEDGFSEDEEFAGSPPSSPAEMGDPDDSEDEETAAVKATGREARVKDNNANVARFQCDEKSGEWCEFSLEYGSSTPKILMLNLVQDAIRKSLVHQVPGLGNCTFVADEKIVDSHTGEEVATAVIHTQGANLRAMQSEGDMVDTNRISTNDIAAMLELYGVEACRSGIIQELSGVFSGHGIGVDSRHLNLIGDYMTRNGGFTPFNRNGLKGNTSPFTKMSFETTLAFMKDALLDGDWDDLSTPSSRLVMGKLGSTGTGSFDVLTRVPAEGLMV